MLGPCLLVILGVGVGGAVKPSYFRWRTSFAVAAIVLTVLAWRGYRDTHQPPAPYDPALERLGR